MNNLEIYSKLKLKDYIKFLLIFLIKNNTDIKIYNLFLKIYLELYSNKKTIKDFYFFYKEYLLLKNLYILKKEKILYNKLKKILLTIKKLINTNNNIIEILELDIINLKRRNMFVYLPFNIDIILIFKKTK
jgi:hypothetical protein